MIKTPDRASAERDRRRRDLVPAVADWLWECDADGRIDFLSPEFEVSTGLAPPSLLGARLAELARGETGPARSDEQRAAITGAKPFRDLVLGLQRTDGGRTWIEIAGMPVFDADRFQGYWGTGKTVSAEIEADLALERYRQLFEVSSEWFWEADAEGRLAYVSPNIEAVVGLPPSAYMGKRLADTEGVIIDGEGGRASLAAIKARQPYRDFIYARKLPGKTVWIASSGAPYYAKDGAFLGYRGIARDVTAQVEAERKSRESEQRFRQLFEIAADHYWETDARQRVTYISPNYEVLTGIAPAEVVGKRLDENPNIAIAPEIGKMAVLAIKAKQPYRDFVYSYKFADGKKRWISLNGVPILGADGSLYGYRGVGSDITYRVDAEHAARLAQQRLDEAFSYVTQPIVVYNGENRVVAFNQAFADLHRVPNVNTPVYRDVSFGELVEWQQRVGFYANGADEEAVGPADLLEVFRNGQEHTYHLWDGRWMLVVYRRLPADGRVGLWTDITAIKRAEAERRALEVQLHHSQRLEALGTLAGGAAHEINNALVPVIGLTKLMAGKQAEGGRERRNLDLILAGAERSRDLVKQILAFSRKEEEERAKQSVDVAAVLRDALKLMRATVQTSIRLIEEIVPSPTISGDPNQLQQVIVNMITNAAQAIGEAQGSITVTLRPEADGAELRLSIADTGCGMSEETRARVFEPFFTTKPVGEGTGLGLSVVHGIVKAHGGRIEVTSTPGQGSRFEIILPASSAEANKAA